MDYAINWVAEQSIGDVDWDKYLYIVKIIREHSKHKRTGDVDLQKVLVISA